MVRWIAPVLLVLLAFGSVFAHVPDNKALSPIDEWVYLDYLAKVPTQGIVTRGEETGQYAREAIACDGVRLALNPDPALCAQAEANTAPDAAFPMGGRTSADIYTPLYFDATWVMAQGFQALGVADLAEAASYAGAVWLALGVLFMFAALRRFGVGRVLAVAIGALVIASPAAFWSSTYVSTDAPALAVGGAMLWLAARIVQGASGRLAFLVVAVIGVLLKVQNIIGVGLAALLVIAWSLQSARSARSVSVPAGATTMTTTPLPTLTSRSEPMSGAARLRAGLLNRDTATAIGAVVLAVLAQAAWVLIRLHLATGPSPDQGTGKPITAGAMLLESLKFLSETAWDPTGKANSASLDAVAQIVTWLAIAGVVGMLATARSGTVEAWLARVTMVSALIAGPLLVFGVVAVDGYYFELPVRYGISMMPAFMACAGLLLGRRRWLVGATVVVAAVLYLAALVGH